MVGLYCRDYLLNDPPSFLTGLSLVLYRNFLAKAVYMHGARIFLVVGSYSARKILVGRS